MKSDAGAPVITIDGASGTGKGTVSRLLAQRLAWHCLDSGALYRISALAAEWHGIACNQEDELGALLHELSWEIHQTDHDVIYFLEGRNVSTDIRTEAIANAASRLSCYPQVRLALLGAQRRWRQWPGLVADGRDMGTVVFPDASLKIFLSAPTETRIQRRFQQLKEAGVSVNLSDLAVDLQERDQRDHQRMVAPLEPASDAICISTHGLSVEDVMQAILKLVDQSVMVPPASVCEL